MGAKRRTSRSGHSKSEAFALSFALSILLPRAIHTTLTYVPYYCYLMCYAKTQVYKLPMGSDVVEVAWKTVVTQRMTRTRMGWHPERGQGASQVPCPGFV